MRKVYIQFYRSPDAVDGGGGAAPALIGEATEGELKKWKTAHGEFFAVKKSGRIAYFKRPGFQELDAYYGLGKTAGAKLSEEWKTLTGLLFLGGDRELIENPKYLPNVAKRIQEVIAGEESELVNF